MSQPYRLSPLRAALVGGALGLLVTLAGPRSYVADATVYFPSINATQFKQMTQVLKAEPGNTEWSNAAPASDSQVVEAACVLLRSRAAVVQGLRDSKINLTPGWLGDPIESLRQNDIQTEILQGTTVRLSVRFPRAEAARALCQSLLDYYTTFVHDHRLTNTARTRDHLEKKLIRLDRRLSVLEHKLTDNSRLGLRNLGDSVVRPDAKTMRELWKKRILEHGSSQRLLEEMRRVRQESAQDKDKPDNDLDDENWIQRWGSTAQGNSDLPNNVRQADVPSRLELERVYEETLLLYHSALLQHDFLSTWESLENFDYELVDPVSVQAEAVPGRAARRAALGALIGLALALLLGRRPSA
jgi:hypothetical protein